MTDREGQWRSDANGRGIPGDTPTDSYRGTDRRLGSGLIGDTVRVVDSSGWLRARVPVAARTRSHHRTKGRSTGRFHGAEIPFHANVGLGFRSIRFGSGHWNDPTAQSDFLPCMCACNVRSSTLGPTTPTLFGSCTRTTAKKLEGFRSGCLLCPRLASQCHPGARTATPRHTVDRSFPPNVAISGFRFHCPYCPIVPTYLPSYLLLFTIVVFAHGSQPRPLLETTTTTW